jgi:dinuclear metal center YbgI/SA1388 family protein
MKLTALVSYLNDYLKIHDYPDHSLNGLQVEGAATVNKVAVAVDGSLRTFERAAEAGAELLIVHHGLFWGQPLPITGMHARRVRYLLERNLSLYAAHLPLDAHPEVGNNWGLARLLGMTDLAPFGLSQGKAIGVKGLFPNSITLRELADLIEKILGESVLVHAGGKLAISSLGIISGGAAHKLSAADEAGLDAFLTGEPKHEVFHEPFERRINALYAGHYMTETVGVKLLADKLRETFGLATEFLLLPTGL